MLIDTRATSFFYVGIVIIAEYHVADGVPDKCGNLEERTEHKKHKNKEIKQVKTTKLQIISFRQNQMLFILRVTKIISYQPLNLLLSQCFLWPSNYVLGVAMRKLNLLAKLDVISGFFADRPRTCNKDNL